MYGSSPGRENDLMVPLAADDITHMSTDVRVPEGGYALLSSVPQNAALVHGVTALTFDSNEELLWSGNSTGRVVSFYGPQLGKYTAFVASNSEVRSLLVTQNAVFALTPRSLKAARRTAISLFAHSSDHAKDLTCMHRLPDKPEHILLGGNQQSIIQLDVEQQKESRVIQIKQKNCLVLRSNQKFIYSSDTEGNVTLRHLSSVDAIHALQAHQGGVSDFDVCGNKLITCGCSVRSGTLTGDRFLMLYDLRTLRPLPPISLSLAPIFCRFLPSFSDSRIMAVSQAGGLIVMDLNDPSNQIPIQLDTSGFAVTSVDVCSTRQCIAFGDQTGLIHLFSDRVQPIFNVNSWETEFPTFPSTLQLPIGVDDTEPSFAMFPLPFPVDGHYVSDWPEDLCLRRWRNPDSIAESVLNSMRMSQFVGYAPNPRTGLLRVFNVCPYACSVREVDNASNSKLGGIAHIPVFYRSVEGWHALSAQDFDIEGRNPTGFNAVVSLSKSNVSSAFLLALYHITGVRNVFLNHICSTESCLSCEINLLFRLLSDRRPPQWISLSPFKRCFNKALEVRSNAHDLAAGSLPQMFHAFLKTFALILDKELNESAAGVALRKEFEISYTLNNHCARCSEHYQSALSQLYISLTYPPGVTNSGFCTLVEKSLSCSDQTEALCQKCGKLACITSIRKVRTLPHVLAIETPTYSESDRTFWNKQLQAHEEDLLSALTGRDIRSEQSARNEERYKVKTQCIFFNLNSILGKDENNKNTKWEHYLPSKVCVKISDGFCTIVKNNLEGASTYVLQCALFIIDEGKDGFEHVVTAVRRKTCESDNGTKEDVSWVLFNNAAVTYISENEALYLRVPWKMPAMLYYVQEDRISAEEEQRSLVPETVLYNDLSSFGDIKMPESGSVVAIQADYINTQDGKRLCTRVCAIGLDGTCFMNDILLPLTADLNASFDDLYDKQTTKKVAIKLLYLAQEGYIIVGYDIGGFLSDMNIYVPDCQIRDIAQLYHFSFKRTMSLNTLALHFFGESVNEESMEPVDVARLSLRLYHRYLEFKESEADSSFAALSL